LGGFAGSDITAEEPVGQRLEFDGACRAERGTGLSSRLGQDRLVDRAENAGQRRPPALVARPGPGVERRLAGEPRLGDLRGPRQ
jgi:hypothetical protein